MAATVFGVAGFVGFHAERLFFAVADGVEAVRGNAEADKILLDGIGTAIAEGEVVFGGAALVAMTLDGDAHGGILLEEGSVFLESRFGIATDFGAVVIEVGIANFLEEELVESRGAICGGLGRNRRSVNRDADGRVSIAAGAAGGDGVGGGSAGSDRGAALGGNGADFWSDGNVGGVGGGPGKADGIAGIDGSLIGGKRCGGLHGGWWRRVGSFRFGDGFFVASRDQQSDRADRE